MTIGMLRKVQPRLAIDGSASGIPDENQRVKMGLIPGDACRAHANHGDAIVVFYENLWFSCMSK